MKKLLLSQYLLACCTLVAAQNQAANLDLFVDPIETLNTVNDEYNGLFANGFKTIYFTSVNHQDKETRKEISLVSHQNDNGHWRLPEQMLSKTNRKALHKDIVAQSPTGDLYVYDGSKPGKITIYTNKKGKWKKNGKIRPDGHRAVKNICFNSEYNQIYFVSKHKKKSLGAQDLFYIEKNGKKWSKPINLGSAINSSFDEISPCLVHDSLLYFASNRNSGLGGYDIYCSELCNGSWQEAYNLGDGINSAYDDAFYQYGGNDRTAIMASNRPEGKGGMDLYQITYILPKQLSEKFDAPYSSLSDGLLSNIEIEKEAGIDSSKITLLRGVISGDDGLLLPATLQLADNQQQEIIATFTADSVGYYEVMLSGGSHYGLAVTYPTYLFHSENFELPEQDSFKEIQKNIELKKIAIGKNVVMKNIFFETAKAELSDESQIELRNVIKLLNENPGMHLEISGHTDNVGSKSYNKRLSEDRAKSVVNYLIDNGIAADRLTAKGYGYDQPIADNKTEEGRKENRRTEFLVTKI